MNEKWQMLQNNNNNIRPPSLFLSIIKMHIYILCFPYNCTKICEILCFFLEVERYMWLYSVLLVYFWVYRVDLCNARFCSHAKRRKVKNWMCLIKTHIYKPLWLLYLLYFGRFGRKSRCSEENGESSMVEKKLGTDSSSYNPLSLKKKITFSDTHSMSLAIAYPT